MKTHLYIIPGNPGIISYYEHFIENLKNENLKVDVLTYDSFLDFSGQKLFSIENEITDKKNQILKLFDPKENNILIGHSIGSWISIKLMQEFNFDSCILIFPFLKKSFSLNQISINLLLEYKDSFISFYDKIRKNYFGKVFLNFYIESLNMSSNSKDITKKEFIKNDSLLNCFNLAKSEFDTLDFDFDFDLIKNIKNKLIFYYCENDMWAPKNDYDLFLKLGYKTKLINNCSHDFCTKKNESKIIANIILDDIKNNFKITY